MPLQIGYLNLWDIFRFIFRQLRMTFFHKIMVAEKNNFSSNAWHNFAKGKVISKCKNDKLKKIKSKKCQPHPTTFLGRPAPTPYFRPLLHILIILGTKYQLNLKILIFWTKFAKRGYFQLKTEKENILSSLNSAYLN